MGSIDIYPYLSITVPEVSIYLSITVPEVSILIDTPLYLYFPSLCCGAVL